MIQKEGTHVNTRAKAALERQGAVQQHNPSPGGTMPAALRSSCLCYRMQTRCQTLWTERDFVNKK